jgi:ATP-dependent Clp protease adaptor protein ClpS
MPRVVEVTLARDVVAPIVESIRRDADMLPARPGDTREASMTAADRNDVRALVELFPPDFPATPTIRITASDIRPIVRACALLRFRLRHHELAAISDVRLQAAKDPQDLLPEADHDAWMEYLFLATITQVALEHFDLTAPSGRWLPRIGAWWDRWRKRQSNAVEQQVAKGTPLWHVVVINDPVNLMSYVTAVLQTVFGVTADVATVRMREVHEQLRSVVWTGPRDRAEAYARTLKTWHLSAVLEEQSRAEIPELSGRS